MTRSNATVVAQDPSAWRGAYQRDLGGIGYPSGRACSPGWGSCSVRCGQSQGSQLASSCRSETRSRTVWPYAADRGVLRAGARGRAGARADGAAGDAGAARGRRARYLVWQLEPAYTLSFALLMSPIAGNWHELHFPTGADPDRLLLAVGILQVLFRSPGIRDRPRIRLTVPHVLLALALLSAGVSAYRAQTLFVKDSVLKLIDSFGVLPFLIFCGAAGVPHPSPAGDPAATLVMMAAYLGLTTLFEMTHLNALVFPSTSSTPTTASTTAAAAAHSSTPWPMALPVRLRGGVRGRRRQWKAARADRGRRDRPAVLRRHVASLERSVWIGRGRDDARSRAAVPALFMPVALVVAIVAASRSRSSRASAQLQQPRQRRRHGL